jgi:Flp pilus assembly protein TadD
MCRAISYEKLGLTALSVRDLDRVVELEPSNAHALFSRGFARDRNGEVEGAVVDYVKALNNESSMA